MWLQCGDRQRVCGRGPLCVNLQMALVQDGAGHSSGHHIVAQSWRPMQCDEEMTTCGTADISMRCKLRPRSRHLFPLPSTESSMREDLC